MQKILQKLVNLIYPEVLQCSLCEKELTGFESEVGVCGNCVDKLKIFTGEGVYGKDEYHYDLVQGLALYEGLTKDMIRRLKYAGERDLAYPLVELMVQQYYANFKGERWDGVIPVPLHEKRLQERGYNQALLLAEGLAFYLDIPCLDCFCRVKETLPQNQLTLNERQENLRGAFALKQGTEVADGRWLVVDDIFTTGATVNELARVLKEAGTRRVGVYVVASGRMM